ncbi:MAG: hypothetical protein JWO10_1866 [Microbacteriaceae bacterium]|nr:hypothetical protein [Microbacteriaceae bacterium]
MKKPVIIAAVAGILLAVGFAAPAQADTTTTTTVTAVTAGDITTAVYPFALQPMVPAGPVTFPLSFTVTSDDNFPSSLLFPGAAAAECTRAVSSFTMAFTIVNGADSVGPPSSQVGLFLGGGDPDNFANSDFTYSGAGDAGISDGIVHILIPGSQAPQSGTVTLTYPAAVPVASLAQFVGFDEGDITITSASFSVTDTCADPIPAAVPDPEPELAATGYEVLPIGLGAAALLAAGVCFALTARRSRRA